MSEAGENLVGGVKRGDPGAVEAALAAGANPDSADRWGVTALAHAATRGDLATVELLLARGAQVDKTSDVGNSPLMMAVAGGKLEIVRLLLDRGADPAAANKWGFGPKDWGSWPGNSSEVLALLRSRGG